MQSASISQVVVMSEANRCYEVPQSFDFWIEQKLLGIALLGDQAALEVSDAIGRLSRECHVVCDRDAGDAFLLLQLGET
jgi:hypothetical protein